MWQDFDELTIRRELAWAAQLKYNGLRVFLHDQMFANEGDVFLDKVDRFLDIASQYGMRCILVLLEGIWDPNPSYQHNASQPPPRPRVHNSRWLQSPGRAVLEASDEQQEAVLKPYLQAVTARFGNDTKRVLLWDLWDQPEQDNRFSYGNLGARVPATVDAFGTEMEGYEKAQIMQRLIPKVVQWVRGGAAGDETTTMAVPLTIPAWTVATVDDCTATYAGLQSQLRTLYLESSDVITFHNYDNVATLQQVLADLRSAHPDRPIVCSSYMARESGSTLDPVLGTLFRENVWAFHWGFVQGKTQTIYNATTWNTVPESAGDPDPWHHDVLRTDGTPYRQAEKDYLLTYRQQHSAQKQEGSTESGSSFLWMDVALVGTAIVLLGAVGLFWRRRETQQNRQRFSMIEEDLADLELRPMD